MKETQWAWQFPTCCAVLLLLLSAVCAGMPTNELDNGYWPETCRDRTFWNKPCTGKCNEELGYFGTPQVMCVANPYNNLFFQSTVTGACVKGGGEWLLGTGVTQG